MLNVHKSCAEAVLTRSVKTYSLLLGTSRRKATLAPLARRSTFRNIPLRKIIHGVITSLGNDLFLNFFRMSEIFQRVLARLQHERFQRYAVLRGDLRHFLVYLLRKLYRSHCFAVFDGLFNFKHACPSKNLNLYLQIYDFDFSVPCSYSLIYDLQRCSNKLLTLLVSCFAIYRNFSKYSSSR